MKKTIPVFLALIMSLLLLTPAFSVQNRIEPIPIYSQEPSESGYISAVNSDNSGSFSFLEPDVVGADYNSLPESYDSREHGVITDVKNQGDSGCCWAFSTMSTLESDAISKGYVSKNNVDFSEAHLAWFTYTPVNDSANINNGEGGVPINATQYTYGGNWQRAACSLASWTGIASESDFPFYGNNISSMGNYPESSRKNQGSGYILNSASALNYKNPNEIKQWIIEHGSCTVAIFFDTAYYDISKKTYYCNDSSKVAYTNHMVTVVGWDDGFSATNFKSGIQPSKNGAWIIKDSWGASTHNGGYFMLSYDDASAVDFAGFTLRPAYDFYGNYNYNASFYDAYLPIPSGGRAANVFRAEKYEKIKAVGIITGESNVSVTVSIYTNLSSNYVSPVSGTPAATQTASLSKEGYGIVELPQTVSVSPGTIFSVVVTYKGSNSTVKVPTELPGDEVDSLYSFKAKQSYYSSYSTGTSFLDMYNQDQECGNFFIQALTECNHQPSKAIDNIYCTHEGASIVYCSQCGKMISETSIPAAGHNFGEWSTCKLIYGTNIKETHRTCERCGEVESVTFTNGSTYVTLFEFLELIFEKISEFFRLMFYKI